METTRGTALLVSRYVRNDQLGAKRRSTRLCFSLRTGGTVTFEGSFGPLLDSAERFAAAARRYFADAQSTGSSAIEAARTFGDFLRVETATLWRFPWSAEVAHGGPPPSAQDCAALGPGREHQLRWQRAAETAGQMGDAQRRLQLLWSDALRDAAVEFAGRLEQIRPRLVTGGGVPDVDTLHALYDSWVDCAEEAYARVVHGETFSNALADYMNAGSAWRKESQAGIELWAKALDLPTRSELNTLMLRVSLLEEQLRSRSSPPPGDQRDPRQTDSKPARRPPRARRAKRS